MLYKEALTISVVDISIGSRLKAILSRLEAIALYIASLHSQFISSNSLFFSPPSF